MKVIERRVLRGPNVHATRPVCLAVIDLEALDGVSSSDLPGFNEALLAAIPGLGQHRCSPGHVGGFADRLARGTYMAHVVEHLALELQCMVGVPVGFGRARHVPGRPRHYRVVFAFVNEGLAEAALDLAIDLVSELAAGRPAATEAGLTRLRELARGAVPGPSTRAILDAAARRGIPVSRLADGGGLFQLGWGVRQQRVQATMTSQTSRIAAGIASDKDLTKRLLREAGLPVPRGQVVSTAEAAQAAAGAARGLVAIKPLGANQGKGVTTAVSGAAAVAAAFERARHFGGRVIVEQHIEGDDHRVLVVGGEVVAASRRLPPEVVGDGRSTVQQLVDAVNADPRRGDGHGNVLTRICLDDTARQELARQRLHAGSVPVAGWPVKLRGNANLSTGGIAQDVTRALHPETALACVRAARKIGLDVAGIDVVCSDITRPLRDQGGAIIEVNAAPGIRMHEHPSMGERRAAGMAIVNALFPDHDNGRIPLIAVTGSNGKTTTALAIAHVLQGLGRVTGVATTEGIAVGGQRIQAGDCTGYWSARTVLGSPEVEVAVLETARGGILKRGLGFDRCDVGVVLNVHNDHLGQDGIQSMRDLARVKGLIVATARKAVVLNADDPICLQLAARAPRRTEVILFGFDAGRPAMARHVAGGGRAVFVERGMLVWADGGALRPLIAVAGLPSTLDGRAQHNVANAMASCAALLAMAVPLQSIAQGLAGFRSCERMNPLRLNVYRTRGITLLVDYAHNAAAYTAIMATGRQLTRGRLFGVVSAPCDRRADDLVAIGRLCGAGFDGLVVYEMDNRRHQPAGETARLIARGASAARGDGAPGGGLCPSVHTVLDVRAAIRAALAMAQPGDLVIVGCASHASELQQAMAGLDYAAVDPAALDDETFEPVSGAPAVIVAGPTIPASMSIPHLAHDHPQHR